MAWTGKPLLLLLGVVVLVLLLLLLLLLLVVVVIVIVAVMIVNLIVYVTIASYCFDHEIIFRFLGLCSYVLSHYYY